MEALWTAKEVANYLKLSPKTGHKTIMRWVKQKRLNGVKVGDLTRFRKQDLEAFLEIKRIPDAA